MPNETAVEEALIDFDTEEVLDDVHPMDNEEPEAQTEEGISDDDWEASARNIAGDHADQIAELNKAMPVAWTIVTPDLAEQWLEHNTRNRKTTKRNLDNIEHAMANDQWLNTGDPVRFAQDGTLLDGQHRLMGVVKSGASIPMVVIHNVEKSSQLVMDIGQSRKFAENLHMLHGVDRQIGRVVDMVITSTWTMGNNTMQGSKSTPSIIEKMAIFERGVIDWVALAERVIEINTNLNKAARSEQDDMPGKSVTVKIGEGVLGALLIHMDAQDAEGCNEFWDKLCSREWDETLDGKDPNQQLFKKLVNSARSANRAGSGGLTQFLAAGLVIKTWNAIASGEHMKQLTFKPSSKNLGLPNFYNFDGIDLHEVAGFGETFRQRINLVEGSHDWNLMEEEKAAAEAERAAVKAAREAKEAEREAAKAAKVAEREAVKAAKAAEREAAKAAKAEAKEAEKAAKAQAKAEKKKAEAEAKAAALDEAAEDVIDEMSSPEDAE